MRAPWLLAAILIASSGVAAQEKKKPPPKKAAAKTHAAHAKATPEQIRRYNELEKKRSTGQDPKKQESKP